MTPKVLIVGQGLSGTFLSWFLYKNGVDFVVIDDNQFNSSSKVAAGLINPVTGRRLVTVWMDDVLLPFAETAYTEIGEFMSVNVIEKKTIIDFFPNPFMREGFLKRIQAGTKYIGLTDDPAFMSEYFNYEFGSGTIEPAYLVHINELITNWRLFLQKENKIAETIFDHSLLGVENKRISYGEIEAEKIVFCDGKWGAQNPWFAPLPFALHKGESLLVEIESLPPDYIYKKSAAIVPQTVPGQFWVGSNYIWDYTDENPTQAFYDTTVANLQKWLKLPFKVLDHRSAIRPATVERRPFAGFHPVHSNIGILNGLGTKGCSLAPYFANQLVKNILSGTPILQEADVARFKNVLTRSVQ
jgi:glycine/D-amino acid oxidase-like deaminating enzyme